MWGFAPMYFKLLEFIPAMEILVHRVVWSIAVMLVLLVTFKQWRNVQLALGSRKVMFTLFVAGCLLAANWVLFIWAVNNDQLLEASLGYYINPLINVFLGRVFLAEKLRGLQKVAVALATSGVLVAIFGLGYLPWIALVLAVSFSLYGLLRKTVAVDSLPGLFIETLMMLPFVLAYWIWFASESSNMVNNTMSVNLLLIAAGIVTTAPLLCFTAAARRIQYTTLGFFQYIGPSIMFILAIFYYGEALAFERLLTFAFVWAALVIFCGDSMKQYRKTRKA
jgi:chloramphenicol-sensitive protein RarD